MTTKLEGPLKRELAIGAEPYTLTISPQGLTLVLKGHRKGYELAWADLVSGDAALATALNASLARGPEPRPAEENRRAAKPLAAKRRRKDRA